MPRLSLPGGEAGRALALALSVALHAALLVWLPARPTAPPAPEPPARLALRLLPAPEPAPPSVPAPAAARPAAHAGPARAPVQRKSTARPVVAAAGSASSLASADGEDGGAVGDLNYRRFYDDNPKHPMRCMVGHVAQSSGDHDSAIYIYEDCAKRGDNFSLLSLAVYYEVGAGHLARDPAKAAEIFHRIATGSAEAMPRTGCSITGWCSITASAWRAMPPPGSTGWPGPARAATATRPSSSRSTRPATHRRRSATSGAERAVGARVRPLLQPQER